MENEEKEKLTLKDWLTDADRKFYHGTLFNSLLDYRDYYKLDYDKNIVAFLDSADYIESEELNSEDETTIVRGISGYEALETWLFKDVSYVKRENELNKLINEGKDKISELLSKREKGEDVANGQKIVLMTPAVWLIAIAGGLFAASRYAVIDWGIFFLQVKKGYSGTDAAMIVTVNSIVGAVSSGLSGIVSDRLFKGSRQELAVAAGLMNVTALVLFMLVPGRHPWLDVTAMVLFGLAVGILLTFLGGLMAVDRVPKCAAGAALGIAGIGSYLGAGLQSAFSGCLVERGADGAAKLMGHTFSCGYTLDWLALFWIGVAALSVVFTLIAGRGRK